MTKPGRIAVAAATWALLSAGGALAGPPAPVSKGIGTDLAEDQRCIGCHGDVGADWGHGSSHSLLMDCRTCHKVTTAAGKGHAETPACSTCHSQRSHPDAATECRTCHDAHGSTNAFLVRETIGLPSGAVAPVRVTKPEGASQDGLARTGVAGQQGGTGTCEVCHASTKVYSRDGKGAPHAAQWCGECHRHENGFRTQNGEPTEARSFSAPRSSASKRR